MLLEIGKLLFPRQFLSFGCVCFVCVSEEHYLNNVVLPKRKERFRIRNHVVPKMVFTESIYHNPVACRYSEVSFKGLMK
jgi:hypothetical protein